MSRRGGTKKRNGVVISSAPRTPVTPKDMVKRLGAKAFAAQYAGNLSGADLHPCDLCAGSGASAFVLGKRVGKCSTCNGTGTRGGR